MNSLYTHYTIVEITLFFRSGKPRRIPGDWTPVELSMQHPVSATTGTDMLLHDIPSHLRDTVTIRFKDSNGNMLDDDPRTFREDLEH